jgi:hypothetical protein
MLSEPKLTFFIIYIHHLKSKGARKLKELRSIVGYQKEEEHADSWLNIQDDEDPRGRVGVSWPWEK